MKHFAALVAAFVAASALGFPQSPAWAADAPSAQANQAYIADFAARKGVTVLPSGLEFRVLQGGLGKRPGPTDTVRLYYSGRLVNGVLFDGTSPGLPTTVPVNIVIRGLSEALQKMHEGDHWQLVVPSDLAYGSKGSAGGLVPPNQALVFDITLVSAMTAPEAASEGLTESLSILSTDNARGAALTIRP